MNHVCFSITILIHYNFQDFEIKTFTTLYTHVQFLKIHGQLTCVGEILIDLGTQYSLQLCILCHAFEQYVVMFTLIIIKIFLWSCRNKLLWNKWTPRRMYMHFVHGNMAWRTAIWFTLQICLLTEIHLSKLDIMMNIKGSQYRYVIDNGAGLLYYNWQMDMYYVMPCDT